MSAATVDRYLKPARDRMRITGISTTKPSPLLRNSIAIRTCADEAPDTPGMIEADTVAHCGPTLIGAFARTLTMTDVATGWTPELLNPQHRREVDRGGHCGAAGVVPVHHRGRTREMDQAHVESKNNHVVRKHAFYWRYDTERELALRTRLWRLVSLRLNYLTPTKKAVGYTTTANGHRKRIYDTPATPWQRLQVSGVLDDQQLSKVAERVDGVNPADLTRRINAIQLQLLDLAMAKTDALAAARRIDLEALQPSISRLTKAK